MKNVSFVDHLENYFYSEVIEQETQKFLKTIEKESGIDELLKSHHHYLDAILKGLFLDVIIQLMNLIVISIKYLFRIPKFTNLS